MIGGIAGGAAAAAVALLSGAGLGTALALYAAFGLAFMVAISLVPVVVCAAQRLRAPREGPRLHARSTLG
ncbi:MAG: hypothetical protein H5U20_11280 [Rhodobacteraceae bacterium]|nr:hypothetical protein [Paracoccaceae bacterium]